MMLEIDRRNWLMQTARGATSAYLLGQVGSRSAWGATSSSTPSRIKIGQIGVGHGHANKLAVYRASSDYEVVGIVEPDESLRQRAAQNLPFRDLPWMTQEQLLNVDGLQAVLVETNVPQLLDTADVCIAAGKHLHLDKPAGSSLPQFQRLMASAKKQQLLVQLGYMYRYNPGILLLRDCLQKGWLGDIFEIHAVMSKVVDPRDRPKLAQYHGGIMFELGCHLIDLVVGIMGKPERVTPYLRQSGVKEDGLYDNTLAILEYPRAIASVKSSAVEVEGGARRHFVVCGTEGSFHIQPLDEPAARLTFSQERGQYRKGIQEVPFPKYSRYVADAADMAKILRGEKGNDFSYEHDLAVQETVLRAAQMPLE